MESTGAEAANVSWHVFTLPVWPLTAMGSTLYNCTAGNFPMDLAIHDHSCQVPDHSYKRHTAGLTQRSWGVPFLGQWTMESKDQDKEDAADAMAKKFRSFGLEVSTRACCHSDKEQPPNSQCYDQEKGHHKGNTRRRKNARVQLTLFECFLLFRDWNRNLWKSFFTCWPGKGCLSRYLLLF